MLTFAFFMLPRYANTSSLTICLGYSNKEFNLGSLIKIKLRSQLLEELSSAKKLLRLSTLSILIEKQITYS